MSRLETLSVRSIEEGLVLKPASTDEFLPSVDPWARFAGLFFVASFCSAMALMAVWPYRVVVRAGGMARPSGETSLVNSPRDGRVREIRIQPNQEVNRGQVIAVLDPTDLVGLQLKLQQDRLALNQQLESLRDEAVAAAQRAELEVEKANATLNLAQSEYQRYRQLVGSGASSVQQMEEKAASLSVARLNLSQARRAVAEQRSRSDSNLSKLSQDLTENTAKRAQLGRDLSSTQVRSPVSGVVFSIALRNPQQVVAAGQELARIAPLESDPLVKVLVSSEDIGNVNVGQRADLRIAGCPYPDFGTLKAEVLSMSPDATTLSATSGSGGSGGSPGGSDPGSMPLGSGYEVTLRPERTKLRSGSRSCSLRLGMNITADITTRQETVLNFLLRKMRLTVGT
jgi:multidrug efflux pump subunit AcrA (membrane-fusion protein)